VGVDAVSALTVFIGKGSTNQNVYGIDFGVAEGFNITIANGAPWTLAVGEGLSWSYVVNNHPIANGLRIIWDSDLGVLGLGFVWSAQITNDELIIARHFIEKYLGRHLGN
jgi:hypothetical protein